jgi:hypothetical protein
MRRALLVLLASLAVAASSLGTAAAASPTVRLTIAHVLHGCHTWVKGTKTLPPATTLTVARGTRIAIKVVCPMDFDVVQLAGPKLALGPRRTYAGRTRTILFARPGVYRLRATNVQSAAELGLATLGPDASPTLTVVVR